MKYVIFKYRQLLMPVIIPQHVTHSQVKIDDAFPVSAGFFKINRIGLCQVYGESESLKLKPAEGDEDLLNAVLNDSGTSAFLKFD